MHGEDGKSIDDVYENEFVTNGKFGRQTLDNTTRIQSSELTGSDSLRNSRSSRAAVVCLVLLCVLLLTAVIVLCFTFTQERQQFISKNENLTNERDQLLLKNIILNNERNQLRNVLLILDEWTFYQFSFYYMSNEMKTWTESRRYCTERGADLIIINNRQEQDFVKKMFGGTTIWIGLIDIEVEGTWKWVDGSTLTSGFWASGEPIVKREENCVVTVDNDSRWPTLFGWFDVPCSYSYQWICEKGIL